MPTSLQPEQLARFARHLTLPEIGESGQVRLLAASPRPTQSGSESTPAGSDAVSTRYLVAAGVGSDAALAELTSPEAVLLGAARAVEAIKSIVEVGTRGRIDEMLEVFEPSQTPTENDRSSAAERGR